MNKPQNGTRNNPETQNDGKEAKKPNKKHINTKAKSSSDGEDRIKTAVNPKTQRTQRCTIDTHDPQTMDENEKERKKQEMSTRW